MSEGTTLQAAEEGDGPTDAIAAPSAGKAREEEEEEAAGLMSGVKAELIDWRRGARPAEFVFALLTIGLLSYSLGSSEWLCGASNAGKMVMVSVSTALEQGAPPSKLSTLCASASAQLSKGKDKDKASLGLPSHHAVACELADAGSGAAGFGGTALFLAFLLLGFIVASELASRGLLGDLQSKLPPGVPAAKLASAAPVALWSLVVLLTYLALLAFALNAPASLGGGPARLGYSYGLARLALLCGLGGAVTHLSLGQGVGEDIVVDAGRAAWPLEPPDAAAEGDRRYSASACQRAPLGYAVSSTAASSSPMASGRSRITTTTTCVSSARWRSYRCRRTRSRWQTTRCTRALSSCRS